MTLAVKGLKELTQAFDACDRELKADLTRSLLDAAEPVRVTAQGLAQANIRRIGPRWWKMRTGVTRDGRVVYLVPASRRRRRNLHRPNLAGLLLDQMDASLASHEQQVEHEVEQMLDRLGRRNGF